MGGFGAGLRSAGLGTVQHALNFFAAGLVVHAHGGQGGGSGGLVVLHQRKQDVLGADVLVRHGAGFLGGDLQDLLGAWRERNHLPDGHHATRRGDALLDGARQFVQIHM